MLGLIKKIIRSVTYQAAKASTQIVLQMDTVGEIKRYLFEQMRDLGMVELMELYHLVGGARPVTGVRS